MPGKGYRKKKKQAIEAPWYNRYYNFKVNPSMLASKAYQGMKYLKSIINTEKKFYDTTIAGTLATAGIVYVLDNLTQGTTYNTRIGNSVLAKLMYIQMQFKAGSAVAFTPPFNPCQIRVILFCDLENRSATPAVTDLLEAASVTSPLLHTNTKRFVVKRDMRYVISDNTPNIFKKMYVPLQDHHIKWNDGNAGTSADFKENHLFLLVIADNITGTVAPNTNISTRLRFIDN